MTQCRVSCQTQIVVLRTRSLGHLQFCACPTLPVHEDSSPGMTKYTCHQRTSTYSSDVYSSECKPSDAFLCYVENLANLVPELNPRNPSLVFVAALVPCQAMPCHAMPYQAMHATLSCKISPPDFRLPLPALSVVQSVIFTNCPYIMLSLYHTVHISYCPYIIQLRIGGSQNIKNITLHYIFQKVWVRVSSVPKSDEE